jgi:hypothetical protein
MLDTQKARAKIRTGGLSAAAVPSPEILARFLLACAEQGVGFKATAGLHHALRGTHALGAEGAGGTAAMHGFLNVLLAAVQAWAGSSERILLDTLALENPRDIRLEPDAIHWNNQEVTLEQIRSARAQFAMGLGSCSFKEPVVDLMTMHWVPVTEKSAL